MAGLLSITVNGKNMQMKVRQASYFDPVILYAAVNPMVSQIDAAIANSSQ